MANKFCWSFSHWKCVADIEEVEKKTPKNISDLKENVQESQHILISDMKSNFMKLFSIRLNEVISSRGKQIRLKLF